MDKATGRALGGAISFVLLLVYVWAAFDMIAALYSQKGVAVDVAQKAVNYSQGYLNTVVTLGGLISALVVAALGTTKPGEMPGMAQINPKSEFAKKATLVAIAGYLFVWTSVGVASLIVGVMLVPEVLPTVADIGNNWLGLAVASAYAYFGIKAGAYAAGADADDEGPDGKPAGRPVPIKA